MPAKKTKKPSRPRPKIIERVVVRQFWEAWLEKNLHRFMHQPVISKSDKNSLTMQFTGINPVLAAFLNLEREISIYVHNTEGGVLGLHRRV